MTKFKIGDRIKVVLKDETLEGIYLPSSNKNILTLKLSSGYNLSIKKDKIKKIEIIKRKKDKEIKKINIKVDKRLPIISILHTGGTIASGVSYETGAVAARFSPEDILNMFPELENIANIRSKFVSNILSENVRFSEYNLLAKEIEKEIKNNVDGIIVTHGTDTMHYTSAALAFILENLAVPVILVGAQRSSDRGSSDAGFNLICAARFIAESDFAEVALCMHKSMSDDVCVILPGVKSRKMHSSRRDAFKAINARAYAEIDKEKVIFLDNNYKRKEKRELRVRLFKDNLRVGLIKTRPNMFAKEFELYRGYDGLVIEGTGLGHMPISDIGKSKENSEIFNVVKMLCKKTIVVMSTQTIFGRVNMNVYSTGRELQDAGVIGNLNDMTAETAYIKLAWLLSNYDKDRVKELISENLRKEINERIGSEFLQFT